VFLGDQKPTFEGMRSTLCAGLNLSLLGFSYWGADVFGLDGETTPETHMRYAQWALLNPVARYFWRPVSIDNTRLPWSHGPQVEANFRTYVELRYQLLPYYYTLAWQAYQTGLPILRPLLLEFPEEARRLAEVYDQVMLGDRLMLCPIVTGGTVSRRVLLPEGTWHDYWTEQSWRGPAEIEYPAALDRLPILVRGGALLPLGPILQHIPDDHRFDDLKLHLWPPYPVEFSLYEDDGCTTAYQHGDFTLTHFRAEGDDRRLIIRILPGEGGFSTQPETRQIEIILHCSPEPNAVWINGILQVSYVGARRKMETTKILNKPAVPLLRYAYDVHAESVIEIEFNPNIAACVV
jgi:alpha-glucosidase